MKNSKIFLYFLISFICGVGIASFDLSFDIFVLYTLLIILSAFMLFTWKNKAVRLILFCLLGIIFGILRYGLSQPKIDESHIAYYNNSEKEFTGMVIQEPDVRKEQTKLTLLPSDYSGRILINVPLFPEYRYGDLLQVKCNLKTPERIEDFSYDKYLSRYGIYSVCYQANISVLARGQGSALLSWMYGLKNNFVSNINQILPEPQSSFLGGLLLGAKKGIPDQLMEDFNRTGTTHIVAISGYNITIIAVLLLSCCKNLYIPRKRAFWLVIMILLLFMIITGAQSSVVRAVTMGIIMLIAKQLGRLSRITNTLILAAVIMLIINPKILIFDAGFQLSFLATMGLIYLSPLLEQPFSRLSNIFQIRESFIATTSATIFTLPLIIFQFGRLSVVSVFVNILILPLIPYAMGVGFFGGLMYYFFKPLANVLFWIVWLILTYIIQVVKYFSGLSFASVNISVTSPLVLILGYAIIFCLMLIVSRKIRINEIKSD